MKGGVSAQDYIGFLCKLVRHYEMDTQNSKLVFFVDNATAHTADIVKEEIESKVSILYNAGYSPFLNPIEEFFSQV